MSTFHEGFSVAFRKACRACRMQNINLNFSSFQQSQLQTQSPSFNHNLLEFLDATVLSGKWLLLMLLLYHSLIV